MIVALAERFRMDPRQLRDALWLAALLFSITSSYTLVKVARDVLYLSEFPASALPVVYLIVGVITLAASWGFGRITHRWPPLWTLVGGAIVSAVVLVLFAIASQVRRPWVPIAFYAWVNVYGLLLVAQFWSFTNSISNAREAKNIFGIVGGGGILGGLLGGIVATALAGRMAIGGFAAAGAGVLLLMAAVVTVAVKRGRVRRTEELPPPGDRKPVPLLSVGYVRWLALASLCAVVVSGLLDFQMKTIVQEHYPGRAALTSFFGRYFIAMNIAALALQFLGTRWFLERLGATFTAGLLPGGLAIGAVVTVITPQFWTVIATRLWDQVARFSVHRSASEVLYFPLDVDVRRRAKAFIEAGIERFGDGLAGILIIALGFVIGTGADRFAGVALALGLLWLYAWWRIRHGYVRQLARQLRHLDLDRASDKVSLRERGALHQMLHTLDSPWERVVLQAIEMLEENAPALLDRRLPQLLAHPAAGVRARALEFALQRPGGPTEETLARLERDPDPRVRLQALRNRGVPGGNPAAALRQYLESTDPSLRATALAALVESTPVDHLDQVRAMLETRLASQDAGERRDAAEALGARLAPGPLDPLRRALFEDDDLEVRRAALRSAGRALARDEIPALIRALGRSETELAAREGLIAFGDRAVGTLGDWLSDPSVPIQIRRTIPRVLSQMPTQEAANALLRARDHDDVVLDYRVLKAENHIRRADPGITFPAGRVVEDLDRDVRELLLSEFHAAAHHGADDTAERFLYVVLRERRGQAFDRVFRRLALLHPPAAMFAAYVGLQSANARVRGSAAEYVENVLAPEHRPWILPLLPDAPAEPRRALARDRYGAEPMDDRASLDQLLESSDAWLRTCALYVVGRRRERSMLRRVERNLDAADPRVRETAGWARAALMGGTA